MLNTHSSTTYTQQLLTFVILAPSIFFLDHFKVIDVMILHPQILQIRIFSCITTVSFITPDKVNNNLIVSSKHSAHIQISSAVPKLFFILDFFQTRSQSRFTHSKWLLFLVSLTLNSVPSFSLTLAFLETRTVWLYPYSSTPCIFFNPEVQSLSLI